MWKWWIHIREEKFFTAWRLIQMTLHHISPLFHLFSNSVRSEPRSVSPSLLFSSDKQFWGTNRTAAPICNGWHLCQDSAVHTHTGSCADRLPCMMGAVGHDEDSLPWLEQPAMMRIVSHGEKSYLYWRYSFCHDGDSSQPALMKIFFLSFLR